MMGVAEDPVRAPPRAAWVRGRIQELTDFLYTMWSFYVLILNYAFNFNVEHAYFFYVHILQYVFTTLRRNPNRLVRLYEQSRYFY